MAKRSLIDAALEGFQRLSGEFDPRYDPRVKEQERLRNLSLQVQERGTQDAPRIPLTDLEGRGFVTTMSDRTRAGGLLAGINDTELSYPVNLQGGQGYMFENPGQVWASAPGVVNQIMREAGKVRSSTGQEPAYIPFRMAPTGGDFAKKTGETMIAFASANMNKKNKKSLDKSMKQFIPDWLGVDNPDSIAQYRAMSDKKRKAIKKMLDRDFRDKGGLNIGEARLAVSDPSQINAKDAGVQNVGQIFTDRPAIIGSGHPSYPYGVPGEGLGTLNRDIGIFDLLPDVVRERGIPDPSVPRQTDIRALQMKPYSGIIDETLLRDLEARGVDINSPAYAGLLAAITAGAMMAPEAQAGKLSYVADLIKQGYPESVARRIASGELDMSPEARLARADSFGQDVYHASKQDITEFKAGYDDEQIYTTPNIDFANNWLGKGKYRFRLGTEDEISSLNKAEREFRESFFDYDLLDKIEKEQGKDAWVKAFDEMQKNYLANKGLDPDDAYKTIYPLKAKAEKTFDPSKDYEKILPVIEKYYGSLSEETIDLIKKGHYMPFENSEVTKWLRDNGYDSIKLSENADGRMTTFAVLSPNQLRSVNAAFDPEYTGSNIMGSRIAPTAVSGLVGANAVFDPVEQRVQQLMQPLAQESGYIYGDILPIKRSTDPARREEFPYGLEPAIPNMARGLLEEAVRAYEMNKAGRQREAAQSAMGLLF